jgi:hypothetical protein
MEVLVTLDRKSKAATDRLDLGDADAAKLRASEAKVAKTEGDVGFVGIKLRQEPGACGIGREELHDGHEVGICITGYGKFLLNAPVAQKLIANGSGQEFHVRLLSLRFSQDAKGESRANKPDCHAQHGGGAGGALTGRRDRLCSVKD